MTKLLIALAVLAVIALVFGVRAYNRAVEAEFAPATPSPGDSAADPEPSDAPMFTDISDQAAQAMLASETPPALLDVRTPDEWAMGIIEGAQLISMQDLQGREAEIPEGPVLVYCAVGGRSASVAEYLGSLGRTELYNLDCGISGWTGGTVPPPN